jgi:DNA-binding NarL/FixJ family response regulator
MDVDAVVLVTSDDVLVSSALARLLDEERRFATTQSSATDAADIDRARRDTGASVVVIDAGSEPAATQMVIRELHIRYEIREVIAVIGVDTPEVAAEMLTAGARGVVARDAEPAELIAAIDEVSSGHVFAPRTAMRLILDRLVFDPATPCRLWPQADEEGLTARERAVVALLSRGMTNQEIAESMFLSEGTVKVHLSRAMSKWGVRGRLQLVIRALSPQTAGGVTDDHAGGGQDRRSFETRLGGS